MSMALVYRRAMLLLTAPRAMVLLVCMGIGGCRYPITMRVWRSGMVLRKFKYRAPRSALAADDMTALMIWATVRTAPLLGGSLELLESKK